MSWSPAYQAFCLRGLFACAAFVLHVASDAGVAVCVDAPLQEFVSEAALH